MIKCRMAFLSAAVLLAGCGLTTPKDERVCMDLVKSVVADPSTVQLNNTKRVEGPSSVRELEGLYRARRDGDISLAAQNLLNMYEEQGVKFTRTFVSLDVTFDGRLGRIRDDALCVYLSYDGKTELTSFTINNQDIEQHQFLDFFLMRDRPKGLDSSYRL